MVWKLILQKEEITSVIKSRKSQLKRYGFNMFVFKPLKIRLKLYAIITINNILKRWRLLFKSKFFLLKNTYTAQSEIGSR